MKLSPFFVVFYLYLEFLYWNIEVIHKAPHYHDEFTWNSFQIPWNEKIRIFELRSNRGAPHISYLMLLFACEATAYGIVSENRGTRRIKEVHVLYMYEFVLYPNYDRACKKTVSFHFHKINKHLIKNWLRNDIRTACFKHVTLPKQ